MSSIEIYKVTINHFRGYCEQKVFDFESGTDLVILAGSNGYGKTSVFDAIEWGFTGKLSRFEEPNEEKNSSCFINFQPFTERGSVSIEFGNLHTKYLLTRNSTFSSSDNTDYSINKSTLALRGENESILYNDSAMKQINKLIIKEEWIDLVNLSDIFNQYHILTQDRIKRFVQGLKAPDRYKQVASMVGTHKFYEYKSFFEHSAKSYENECDNLQKKKENITNKINSINEQIKSEDELKINMGNFNSIGEWINCLVDNYNKILETIDGKQFSCINNNLKDVIQIFKNNTIETKNFLQEQKNVRIGLITKINELLLDMENYMNYKSYIVLYKEILPLFDRGSKLLTLQRQLANYREFDNDVKKFDSGITNIKSCLSIIETYLLNLTHFYDGIKNYKNGVKLDCGFETIKLQETINFSTSGRSFLENDYSIFINNNFIVWNDYTCEIESMYQYNNQESISKNTLKEVDEYFGNINRLLPSIIENENKISLLKNEIFKLENEIKSLSHIEIELKDILSESLRYIENSMYESNEANCPVCATNFNKDELIAKIENRLKGDNTLISSKIKKKKELEEQANICNNSIIKTKEVIFDSNNELMRFLEISNEHIKSLEIVLRKEKNICNDNIEQLIQNKNNSIDRNIRIISQIEALGLSKLPDDLEVTVAYELNNISNSLAQHDFTLNSFEVSELTKDIARYSRFIDIYRKKLDELGGIGESDIFDALNHKKETSETSIANFDKAINDIKNLEESIALASLQLNVSEKRKELEKTQTELEIINKQKTDFENIVKIFKVLSNASTEAIQEISMRILSQHEAFINTIYKRINPHPLFTDVKFDFRKNNRGYDILNIFCEDKDNNNTVNPAFTFSSAQVNIIAVSIFLGMALRQQCTNLRTIMLDDPIQNMDDLNVISFIDILRNYLTTDTNFESKKQIIISTHDQDFYRLMVKKFRHIKNKAFEFIDYNSQGPRIIESKHYI